MSRILRSTARGLALVFVLTAVLGGAGSVAATVPQGAVKWSVDDVARTIKVSVKLEIYSACNRCPGAVNQFLVDKMKQQILDVWNAGHMYRCYTLVVEVDILIGTNQSEIDRDRVGVRIDNSPVPIHSYVHDENQRPERWDSDDPADRIVVENASDRPTTWSEEANGDGSYLYAHEFGHILGLHDTYVAGRDVSVPYPGAPVDVMTQLGDPHVEQATIDRLIKRSTIDRSKLKCGLATESHVAPNDHYGEHCNESSNVWLIKGRTTGGGYDETWEYRATIEPGAASGPFTYKAAGSSAAGGVTKNGGGVASLVRLPDGSAVLTFGDILVKGVITAPGSIQKVQLPVFEASFTWLPAEEDQCVP
jgi:hypothetical protein